MTCRATEAGYYTDEHLDDCDTTDCRGCWPCVPTTDHGDPLDHCTARTRCTAHIPPETLTCPRCIAKTRWQIHRIAELTPLLPVAAVESGRVDSPAADLAGPAANPEGWSRHKITALHDGTLDTLPDDDPEHPYAVLGRWDMMLREDYGPATALLITVDRAADYLDRQVHRMSRDPEQDFPGMVSEVAACLARVRQVLAISPLVERGAPCHLCPKPAPHLIRRRVDHDTTGASDRWVCPEVHEHRWTEAEYRLRVGAGYLHAADRLTASQVQQRFRVATGTVRSWASRGHVRAVGRDSSGRTLYSVADVERMRDTEPA